MQGVQAQYWREVVASNGKARAGRPESNLTVEV